MLSTSSTLRAKPLPAIIPDSANTGLRLTPNVLALSVVCVAIAGFLYQNDHHFAAMLIASIPACIITVSYPAVLVAALVAGQAWDQIFNASEETGIAWLSPGRVLTLAAIAGYIHWRLKHPSRIGGTQRLLLLWVLFGAWTLVASIWAVDPHRGLNEALKICIQIGLLCAGADLLGNVQSLKSTFFYTFICGALAAAFLLSSNVAVTNDVNIRLSLQGTGINAIAITLGTVAMIAVGLLSLEKSRAIRILAVVCLVLLLMAILRTGTRSVVVAVPLAAIASGCGVLLEKPKQSIVVILSALLVAGFYYKAAELGFIEGRLLERIQSSFSIDELRTNGRWDMWKEGLTYWVAHPWGTGPGCEWEAYGQQPGTVDAESHNLFVSVLIQTGPVGLLLFLVPLFVQLRCALRLRSQAIRTAALGIMLFILLQALKGSFLGARIFWQPMMLIMIAIEADFRLRCRVRSAARNVRVTSSTTGRSSRPREVNPSLLLRAGIAEPSSN